MKFLQKSNLILLLLCLPLAGYALSTDRDQPILIEAEHVEIDRSKGFSHYEGNVEFRQGSLIIRGEKVLIYYKDNKIERIVIEGTPASFQQTPDKGDDNIVSRAGKMEYIASKSRLFLFDSARVSQGKNSFEGEKIEYDMVNGTVIAKKGNQGRGRVQAIIEEKK